jgi:signal transduction histidine kinase
MRRCAHCQPGQDEAVVQLTEMPRKLIENGLSHGAGADRVEVVSEQRQALATVHDEGAGLPPELGEAVFERLRKADPTSPGAGLDLAIVRRIVDRDLSD